MGNSEHGTTYKGRMVSVGNSDFGTTYIGIQHRKKTDTESHPVVLEAWSSAVLYWGTSPIRNRPPPSELRMTLRIDRPTVWS